MNIYPLLTYWKRTICVIFILPFLGYTQEVDSLSTDSLALALDTVEIAPPPYYLGVYLEGGISIEPSAPDRNVMAYWGGGMQYQKWAVGFSIYEFQGSFESFVIFPNVFDLKYRYGGPNIGYYFFMNRKINISANISYLRGDMIWRDKEDGQDFFRDEFDMLKAGLKFEFGKIRYLKPYVSVGYQRIRNLELTGLMADDFTGVNYSIGIRLGYFNQ